MEKRGIERKGGEEGMEKGRGGNDGEGKERRGRLEKGKDVQPC